jgi:hypothetical protein
MPEEIESVVKDYRLLQYDLLLGEQFTFPARPAQAADVNRGTASRPPG